MRTLLLALTVSLALAVGAGSSPAEAHVIRVEHANHKHRPATVKYIEHVVIYHGTKVKRRYVYVELFNGATFRVNHCKRPVRMDMHMKRVRRLCGHR